MNYAMYKKLVIRKLSKRSQLSWLTISKAMGHTIRDNWQAGKSITDCVDNLIDCIRQGTK